MRNYSFLLGFLLVSLFPSCIQKRYIHGATAVLNPLFKQKGDGFASAFYATNGHSGSTVSGSASATTDSKTGGVTLQGGYAFGRHIGLAASFDYMHQEDEYSGPYSEPFDQSSIKYNRSSFSLAGNYFTVSKNGEIGMNLVFGANTGKLRINDAGKLGATNYSRYFNSNSLFLFVQPSLNFYLPGNSAVGLSTRFNYMSYHDNETNYTPTELQAIRLDKTSPLYLSEVGVKGLIGLKSLVKQPLCLDAQLNYVFNHSGRIHVKRTNVAVGLTYRF